MRIWPADYLKDTKQAKAAILKTSAVCDQLYSQEHPIEADGLICVLKIKHMHKCLWPDASLTLGYISGTPLHTGC